MLKSSRVIACRILALVALFGGLLVCQTKADLFVSTYNGNSVQRYNENTGQLTASGQIVSGSGGLAQAQGITQGPDGTLYASSGQTGQILHYRLDGSFLGVFATLPPDPTLAGFGPASPGSLHFGPDGNLYVSDNGGTNVYRYTVTDVNPQPTTVVTAPSGGGDFAFTGNNDLYVSDFGGGRVVKRSAATGGTSNFFTQNFDPQSPSFAPCKPRMESSSRAMGACS